MRPLRTRFIATATAVAAAISLAASARAEQVAMVLFETKPDQAVRKEGIAFVELDRTSPDFGTILAEIPLPPETVAHHIFYNPDRTKAYVTSLGSPKLWILDVTRMPYRSKVVSVPDCMVGEDVAFSPAAGRWYLTCMGSSVLVAGDMETDEVLRTIPLPAPYPHGVTVHDGIDRMLVTSTVNPADPADAGESIVVLQPSTGEVLSVHKVSDRPSPSKAAPVEAFFVPGAEPPLAYVTNMLENTLWLAEWQPGEQTFTFRQVLDLGPLGQSMPLEVYFDDAGREAYVSTAKPGHVNVLDISDPRNPRHTAAIETAGGAHHMVFSPDGRLAYVQNGLMNIPGINDGSISVVDLGKAEKVASIDVFKEAGQTVNMIELLPEYGGGHSH